MIKTAPHSTFSPQMWCIKKVKDWFARHVPRFIAKNL